MQEPTTASIDFELFRAGPAPTRRTARQRPRPLMLRCTACGDEGPLKDPRIAPQAAAIHARTAHDGATARVRTPADPGA